MHGGTKEQTTKGDRTLPPPPTTTYLLVDIDTLAGGFQVVGKLVDIPNGLCDGWIQRKGDI